MRGVRHLEDARAPPRWSPSPKRCAPGARAPPGTRRVHADRPRRGARPATQRARHRVGVGHGRRRARRARSRRDPGRAPALSGPTRSAGAARPGPSSRRPRRSTRRRPGQPHRVLAQPSLGRRLRPPVGDQADVRRRPAHVEGDGVPEAERPRRGTATPRRPPRARTPPWRADAAARPPPTSCRRSTGAGGASRRRPPGRARPRGRRGTRSAIGMTAAFSTVVARALVLPVLRVDLVRDGDEGDLPLERRTEARLVGRMRVGVEEADRHRLDAARAELGHQRRQLVLREGDGDLAVGEDALRHLEPEVARHERRRPRRAGRAGRGPGGSGGRSRARRGSPAW